MGFFTTTPAERYGPSLLDRLPLGISVYKLLDRNDPHSFVLAYSNAASGRITGLDVKAELGRRLVDVVPVLYETDYPDIYAEVVRSGQPRDLGTVEVSDDDRIGQGTYAVRAIPVSSDAMAIVFENVGDRAEVQELHEAQDQLAAETARYRSLVEAAAAVVWTTTPEGGLLTDLDRWESLTGQSPEESAGAGWVEAVHPDDREGAAEAWRTAVEAESLYRTEYRLRQPDGTYRLMEARGAPVRDADGRIVEWVGTNTDVEAERAAVAALAISEARFQTLFDALGDVVLVYPLGADGPEPFVFVNDAAVARYGYSRAELATMTVTDVLAPDRLDLSSALAELHKTRRATFDSTHITRDGTRLPMATSARLVELDGRLCVVSLCRDDSASRQFRRQIARANRELEAAVAERTAQLEGFSEDLKILHRITTARHETPAARYDAYLRAGCEMFDLPVGILSATPTDPETGQQMYRLEAVVSPDPEMTPGLTVPLSDAFCDAVVERGETVVYGDAGEEAPGHPACVGRGLRAFIGTPVVVDGELTGTLNFVSPEPRPNGFSPVERDLIEVMAEAIGRRLAGDRAEEAETAAREQYRTIVETVDSGVIVVDRNYKIVMSNPSARVLLGLDVEHGHDETDHMQDRWPVIDADGERVRPEDLPEREALRTGQPVRGVLQGITPEGAPTRWYRVNATPIDDDQDGTPDAVVVSFHDVTDFRETAQTASRTQDLLRAVLLSSADGVMAFRSVRDDDGTITDFEWLFVSPLAAQIVGRDAEDLIGHQLLEVFPGNREAGLFDAYAAVVRSGTPFETTVPYTHDGFETSFAVRAAPLKAEDGFTVSFSEVIEAEVVSFKPADLGAGVDGADEERADA